MPWIKFPYKEFDHMQDLPLRFGLADHLGGFDKMLSNSLLSRLQGHALINELQYEITLTSPIAREVQSRYPNLTLIYDWRAHDQMCFNHFLAYHTHPEKSPDHFICTFNGSPHVSRKLLTAILHRFGWFNPHTCSKNFVLDVDVLDGHLLDYLDAEQHRVARKFFIAHNSGDFLHSVFSFGLVQDNHAQNIHILEQKLTHSFLHVVSETLATSYHPFFTEKFLYSVVTRGLFLAYAQPGWHTALEKYFGFKKYDKVFDYRFDSIKNPVERLTEMMSMLAKFSVLSPDDWRDLYVIESDTIEYNHDWYFSQKYLAYLSDRQPSNV